MKRKRTSRAKSHSASSNARLTCVALLGAVGFAGIFASFALREAIGFAAFAVMLTACAVALCASIMLFAGFRR